MTKVSALIADFADPQSAHAYIDQEISKGGTSFLIVSLKVADREYFKWQIFGAGISVAWINFTGSVLQDWAMAIWNRSKDPKEPE